MTGSSRPRRTLPRRRSGTARARAGVAAAVAVAVSLVLGGCTGQLPGAAGEGAQLQFGSFGGGDNPRVNYNPFLPATRLSPTDYLYEPLMFPNGYSCEPMPWLATKYTWTDPSTLVFTMRSGVSWTDGQQLTAKDAAYTYGLLKKYSAFDVEGVWSALTAVEAQGNNVVFRFKVPGLAYFWKVLQTRIVPEHIWSSVKNPQTWTNPNPVSSGPMVVDTFTPTALTIRKNTGYWQKDKVSVGSIRFSAASTQDVEQLKLARGDYDSQGVFIPDIQNTYVSKNPTYNKYWFPPGSPISLFWNLEKAPFDDLAFRRAMSMAIDRERIAKDAEFGYVKTASQSLLVLPSQAKYLPSDLSGTRSYIPYDRAKAAAALDAAGYRTDSSGNRLSKDGKPMKFTFMVPSGYTDWIDASKIIQQNLKDLGIQLDVQSPTPETVDNDRSLGEFDLTFGVRGGGCTLYQSYSDALLSTNTAPTGKKATTNEVRWRDPATDAALGRLRDATTDAEQKAAVGDLARIMVDQVPFAPLWYGGIWFEYRTKNATGWPNAGNPYSAPGDNLVVITRLQTVKKG